MTIKVAVLTAIYDGYDVLRPVLPQNGDFDIEWICVTDTPSVVNEPQGWNIRFESRPGVHPNLAAKKPKMTPEVYTEASHIIWLDASFQIRNADFVSEALAYADPIAQFIHPDRTCLYDEANISAGIHFKYGGHPFTEQTGKYKQWGHPKRWGLWATGVIARKMDNQLECFGRAWLQECELYSFQDQVSQPAVLRQFGLYPTSFPGTPYDNPWLRFKGSGRH